MKCAGGKVGAVPVGGPGADTGSQTSFAHVFEPGAVVSTAVVGAARIRPGSRLQFRRRIAVALQRQLV